VPFELLIVTPQGPAYSGEVESVLLPGSEGDFGVLPSHERLLAPLRIGAVEIHTGSEIIYAAIASGFAEVDGTNVAVMVESCECANALDVARAELARRRAEEGLAALGDASRWPSAFSASPRRSRPRVVLPGAPKAKTRVGRWPQLASREALSLARPSSTTTRKRTSVPSP
jgi:F-type H+-transporting ATPase subunit epsilon